MPAPPADEPTPTACRNCGARLALPRPNFCPGCGQETDLRPPTLATFFQQLGGAYLSTEGALWRSLALLLLRPGELTRQYLAGRRKHYVLPLRLYLTVSVVTLLLFRFVAAPIPDVSATGFDPRKSGTAIDIGYGRAGMTDGTFHCANLPAWPARLLRAGLISVLHSLVLVLAMTVLAAWSLLA